MRKISKKQKLNDKNKQKLGNKRDTYIYLNLD